MGSAQFGKWARKGAAFSQEVHCPHNSTHGSPYPVPVQKAERVKASLITFGASANVATCVLEYGVRGVFADLAVD